MIAAGALGKNPQGLKPGPRVALAGGRPGCYVWRLRHIMGPRRGGRAVEGARLESVYTGFPYRGFESHPLRHEPGRPSRPPGFMGMGARWADPGFDGKVPHRR